MEKIHIKKIYHKSITKVCPECGLLFKVYYSNRNRFSMCNMTCRKAYNAKKREAKRAIK